MGAGQPPWLDPNGARAWSPPDYPNDLNAVQTIIEKIRKYWPDKEERLDQYHKELARIYGSSEQAIDATAKQRCDALFAAFPDVLIFDKSILEKEMTE